MTLQEDRIDYNLLCWSGKKQLLNLRRSDKKISFTDTFVHVI